MIQYFAPGNLLKPQNTEISVSQRDTATPMFIAVLFTIAKIFCGHNLTVHQQVNQ